MNLETIRLVLIADRPSVGETVEAIVAQVLQGLPPASVMVIDRDRPPALGGTPDRERMARLARLRRHTAAHGAVLAVTARADLALAARADGVQLPEQGLDPATVRAAFPTLALGRSTHDRAGLLAAEAAGVDWAFLSPVRAPLSKPPSGPPLGIDGFRRCVAGIHVPVFALGGIAADLVAPLRRAGAHGVATIGTVFGAADPARAASALIGPT